MLGRLQDWLARANREFQNVIIKDLSVPPAGKTAEDEIAKKLQETKAEEAKQAEEARRTKEAQEQAKRDEEKRRLATKDAEAQRKKAEDDARKAADALKKKAAEDAEKAAAAQPQPQPNAAAKEKARIAEELRKTEQAQQDEARKKLNALNGDAEREEKARQEAVRQAEEARKLEEERRKAEAVIAEERRKRDAQQAAEARRRAEEAQQRQAETERQQPPPAVQPQAVEQPKAVAQPAPAVEPPAARQRRVEITAEPLRGSRSENRPGQDMRKDSDRGGGRTIAADDTGRGDEAGPPPRKERKRRIRLYRVAEARVPYRGTAVKRFVYRVTEGSRDCRAAGRTVRPPARYTVTSGDSLWRISDQHYSSGARWPRIYRANRDKISEPGLIYPCQRFLVPRR